MISAVFGLSGCVTLKKPSPLAPSPPEVRFTNLYDQNPSAELQRYLIEPKKPEKTSLSSEMIQVAASSVALADENDKTRYSEETQGKSCALKDRFDRKAVLAYEWDRSRLALDVDGLGFSGSDDVGIKIEYRLRLQPEKTRKEKCRYASSWQGILGSGYNEFFVREEDTVFEELREMRTKISHYLDDEY